MFDWLTGLFSTAEGAAAGAEAAKGIGDTANTAQMLKDGYSVAQAGLNMKDLANIGTLVGGLGSAYGSVMGANLQNGYAKKMLNLQEDNIAYQKEKEKKKQAAFDLAASTAFAPTVAPKLNLGA